MVLASPSGRLSKRGVKRVIHSKGKPANQFRNALRPLIQDIDVVTLSKRILAGYMIGVIIVEAIIVAGAVRYLSDTQNLPKELKFAYDDLEQIHTIGVMNTIAIATDASATPYTITVPPPPTKTPIDVISIETLTTDNGERNAGDTVYRIPERIGQRLQDFLGMVSLSLSQDLCKGKDLAERVPDTAEVCLRQLRPLGAAFADDGPEGVISLRQQDYYQLPDAGQAIGFPIRNYIADGVQIIAPIIVPIYRLVRVRIPNSGPTPGPSPPNEEVFEVATLA
ncbi:hypothetical protein BU26DRAFT_567826 [Trematosphaeria pertusa]|uniref:Uncharacterized protein n=1 Tax=Trematosphaeria pertusa TaxID=390896 RepID=A0A6A6I8D0_9PLEO|nr:uncharacterized protein BU26DRAFT_567826 [Trematosphaeria pertusa]KAF2246338.1 hypothetical protein BU26DRAFT_567826 [Trematosphaeria pertusa]